jgi:hypothetical protein
MIHPRKKWASQRPGNILPVFFLSLFFSSAAQGILPDAYSIARGEVCAVRPEGGYSLYNPALLPENRSVAFLAGHARPFAIREIGVTSVSGLLPVYPGSLRLMISGYGISGYNDLSMELGYGLQLSEHLSAGISFQYYNTTTLGDWNYLWTVGWGAGLLYAPSNAPRIGIVLLNPFTAGNHSGYGPLFPTLIAAGLTHRIYESTHLLLECSYRINAPLQLKFGLEYGLNERISLVCGAHSAPATYAFGAGFIPGDVEIHFATAWSALPGIHPSILFIWLPRK